MWRSSLVPRCFHPRSRLLVKAPASLWARTEFNSRALSSTFTSVGDSWQNRRGEASTVKVRVIKWEEDSQRERQRHTGHRALVISSPWRDLYYHWGWFWWFSGSAAFLLVKVSNVWELAISAPHIFVRTSFLLSYFRRQFRINHFSTEY